MYFIQMDQIEMQEVVARFAAECFGTVDIAAVAVAGLRPHTLLDVQGAALHWDVEHVQGHVDILVVVVDILVPVAVPVDILEGTRELEFEQVHRPAAG
jgi:hypothetical protein